MQKDTKIQDAKNEIETLTQLLSFYEKKYYIDDDPQISDYEYDALMRKLTELENEYPEYKLVHSPTSRVGGQVAKQFASVNHPVPLESLQDAFSFEEIYSFDKRVRETVRNPEYVVELKIDGLSVSIEYENGKFVRGATRGNGLIGEDVSNNIKTIKSIPLQIDNKIDRLIVRGEVFMPKSSFIKLNEQRELTEQSLFANPRNAAAGSLRQLDSSITASRNLDAFIFNLQLCLPNDFQSHSETLDFVSSLGFKVSPTYNVFSSINDVTEEIKRLGDMRNSLEFDIDGAVVKVNNLNDREKLGSTAKFPKWAIAYKYPPEKKFTVLRSIVVNVGRTGVLTPNAEFDTVNLAGTNVSRATLHNFDMIEQKDIRIGDTICVQKAGDIIPEVVEVDISKRSNKSYKFSVPTHCPVCNSIVVKEQGEVAIRCINPLCSAQLLRNIIHFASKDAMDIESMGPSVAEKLLSYKYINSCADIYYINKEQLLKIDGFKDKSADNLISAIEKSKTNDLSKLVFALGIRHVGQKAAKILASRFKTLDNIINADYESLVNIDDIGDTTANSIIDFFAEEESKQLVEQLRAAGINFNSISASIDNRFEGKIFVLTGTLEKYKRDEAQQIIESMGGKTASSVSKKTSYVLAGEEAGSKLQKANELGVQIISEQDFIDMIK